MSKAKFVWAWDSSSIKKSELEHFSQCLEQYSQMDYFVNVCPSLTGQNFFRSRQ